MKDEYSICVVASQKLSSDRSVFKPGKHSSHLSKNWRLSCQAVKECY